MIVKSQLSLLQIFFLVSLALVLSNAARGSNPFMPVSIAELVQVGQIPIGACSVILVSENAKIVIKHDQFSKAIVVRSNCLSNWNLNHNVIRQVVAPSKGSLVRVDAAGSVALVNGKVFPLPNNVVHGLQISNGRVLVNGSQIKPLVGSGPSENCQGADVLTITIPAHYRGDLKVSIYGSTQLDLDSWTRSNVTINVMNQAILKANKLNKLNKLVLNLQEDGEIRIHTVTTKNLIATASGMGKIIVENGYARDGSATVSDAGKISLNGRFDKMKKEIHGKGAVLIN